MKNKYMKYILLLIVLIIIVLFVYTYLSYKSKNVSITSIQFDTKSFGLKVNKSRQIEYIYLPEEGNGPIRFKSSNENIIEVNSITGYVTAKKVGNATIYVLDENNNVLQQCVVYGLKNEVEVIEIGVEKEIKIANGKSYIITMSPTPSNAVIPKLKYTSSDENIVKIVGNGKIRAVGVGSAYVEITSKDLKIEERVLVVVNQSEEYTIKENTDYTVDVEKIEVKEEKVVIKENEVYQIEAEVIPSNATNKELSYKSTDDRIVEILEDGVIKGKKVGITIVEIRSVNNIIKRVKVEVEKKKNTTGNTGSNNNNEILATGIKIEKTEINMVEAEEKTIEAEVIPSDATNKNLIWTSSNIKVAKIENGKIKAIGKGSCTITVKTKNNIIKKIEVKVVDRKIEVEDVAVNVENVKIGIEETQSVRTVVSPTNATDKSLTWTSSNPSVATVTNEGLIKGIKAGNCIVIVRTINGIEKKINVEIKRIEATKLELTKEKTTIKVGDKETIGYSVSPSNVTEKIVTWTSSNTSIAIVDNKGEITGKKAGTATITAQIGSIFKNVEVTILNKEVKVEKITISGNTSVTIGNQIVLKTIVIPSNATDQKISWKSSDESIATVDSDGLVKGIKVGEVTITAIAGGKSNSCTVKVTEVAVNSISLNPTKVTLEPNKSQMINAVINPSNATNKNLTWTSSNPSVVKVSSSGIITAIKEGMATITAKSNDGKIATCTVTIKSNTFKNPVSSGGDPWVTQKDGYYYYTRTMGTNITIYKSSDLTKIESNPKIVFTSSNTKGIWAPELHYIEGSWYIYYADATNSSNSSRRMHVLRSKTNDAQGEYEYLGQVVGMPNSLAIDGTIFKWNTEYYFLWSAYKSSSSTQQRIYIAHMSNPYTVDSDKVEIAKADYDWEKHGNYINEGPQVLIKDGVLHIIYSASGANTIYYCLGMLTYTGGDLLKASSWKKASKPVFESANGVYGPGHASFVKSPDGKEDWIVYHAVISKDDAKNWRRTIRIQKYTWNGTTPVFGSPISLDTSIQLPSGTK